MSNSGQSQPIRTEGARVKAAIIGTGKLAQGICNVAHRNGYFVNNSMVMGARRMNKSDARKYICDLPRCPVVSIENALQDAEVVILAIPQPEIEGFAKQYAHLLKGNMLDTDGHRGFSSQLQPLLLNTKGRLASISGDCREFCAPNGISVFMVAFEAGCYPW